VLGSGATGTVGSAVLGSGATGTVGPVVLGSGATGTVGSAVLGSATGTVGPVVLGSGTAGTAGTATSGLNSTRGWGAIILSARRDIPPSLRKKECQKRHRRGAGRRIEVDAQNRRSKCRVGDNQADKGISGNLNRRAHWYGQNLKPSGKNNERMGVSSRGSSCEVREIRD
jgi:hypothetical protein